MFIKPFCGIRSSTCNQDINNSRYVLSINNQENIFFKEKNPAFYVCRTTYQNDVCYGIIAQVDCHNFSEKIYKHEECFFEKLSDFCSIFQESNIQTSPTLLVHDDQLEIEQYLSSITTIYSPDIVTHSKNVTYEIWITSQNKKVEDDYNSIKYLFLADGHHRISSLFTLNKNVLAYIIQKKYLKSYPIIRKYHNFEHCPSVFFERTRSNFNAKTLSYQNFNSWEGDYFILTYDQNKIALSNGNTRKDFQDILTFFSDINHYDSQKPNFTNYKHSIDCKLTSNHVNFEKNDFLLFIPAINIDSYFLSPKKLLPIHSSWFEPKIPPGIVQMEIL